MALPPGGSQAFGEDSGRVPKAIWRWGVVEAFCAAVWSGPTASFLSAFAVELGAGGGQLGILLALNTFLSNGLQLQGARWARAGSGAWRVYGTALVARGSWLLAGAVPAALMVAGYPVAALVLFLVVLGIASVAAAAASPAMGARASTAGGETGRTRYLADRAIATWVGSLVGTAAMTGLLQIVPGVTGYGVGFGVASLIGLLGIGAYATLIATERRLAIRTLPPASGAGAPAPAPAPAPAHASRTTRPVAGDASTSPRAQAAQAAQAAQGIRRDDAAGVWRAIARRSGAPPSMALGSIVIGAAILQGGASMIGPAAPIWLVRHLEVPASYLGALSLMSSLTAIASQRLWARWIDRAGPGRVLTFAGAAAAVIPIGWMLVWAPWVAIPLNLYSGVAWGGYSLAMTSRLLQLAPPAERPAYLGTYAAAVGIAGAIGSLLAGGLVAFVPIGWIPVIFLASFLTRGLGWWSLRGKPAPVA